MISDQKIIKAISLNLKYKVLETIRVMIKIGLQLVIVPNDKNQLKGKPSYKRFYGRQFISD
jgi:hypothetical protein